MVVQMSQFATDPLLEKDRVVTTGQPVATVVGLDHQCIEVLIAVQHGGAIRTQVGQQTETPRAVTEDVLRRLLRIVGHGNDANAQPADLQLFTTGHEPCRFNRLAHPAQGATAEVNRNSVAPRQQTHAMHVVGMFVGHQYRAQLRRVYTQAQQAFFGFPQGETTIDQDVGVITGYQRAVPLATAAENGETHLISPSCPESCPTLCAPHQPAPRC
ncbi:hypothetical protein D3C78_726970 [compost metagenome]